jgi:hypothetical protein
LRSTDRHHLRLRLRLRPCSRHHNQDMETTQACLLSHPFTLHMRMRAARPGRLFIRQILDFTLFPAHRTRRAIFADEEGPPWTRTRYDHFAKEKIWMNNTESVQMSGAINQVLAVRVHKH